MVFSKVRLTSISLLLTPFVCFYALANTEVTAPEIVERIPTEELVEGIKSSDGRWFEVEMIIFERNDSQDVREQFSDEVKPMTHRHQWDLIREALSPDIRLPLSKLPQCHLTNDPLLNIEQAPEPIEFTDALISDPIVTTPLVIELNEDDNLDPELGGNVIDGVVLNDPFQEASDLENGKLENNKLTYDILAKPVELSEQQREEYALAAQFFERAQEHKKLINKQWRFTNELCLLPNESLSGYWRYDNDLPELSMSELSQVVIDKIPSVITGGDYDDFHNVYLIGEQSLGLKEQYYTLKKHPKLNPIAHLGWRQPGLSKRRAKPVYIVAGENLSDQFRYDGSEIIKPVSEPIVISDYLSDDLFAEVTEEDKATDMILDSLFENNPQLAPKDIMASEQQDNLAQFMQQLESGAVVDFKNSKLVYPEQTNLPQQTFKLDGYVKIHLNHYLFLDAQFNYREIQSEQIDPNEILNADNELVNDDIVITEMSEDASLATADSDDTVEKELVTINYLKNYAFKQDRRFYSGDLHYLDHPKFGILIQIRKYRH